MPLERRNGKIQFAGELYPGRASAMCRDASHMQRNTDIAERDSAFRADGNWQRDSRRVSG
jgi:hypothetical protein